MEILKGIGVLILFLFISSKVMGIWDPKDMSYFNRRRIVDPTGPDEDEAASP